MSTPNPLEMSDEDFGKLAGPPVVEDTAGKPEGDKEPVQEELDLEPTGSNNEEEDTSNVDSENDGDGSEEAPETDDSAEGDAGATEQDGDEGAEDGEGSPSEESSGSVKPKQEVADTGSVPADVETLQGFYKQIMAPFKANGKMITLNSPEEVISLMQMGANYTKKLQDIQPHRKMLLMLENNGLLDQDKLSYLIDLDKKNPEAIKKLIKDAGIDPLDIDTNVEPQYQAGNHTVSDNEARFRDAVEELTSRDTGKETISIIDKTWDDVSKDALWEHPEIMGEIQTQRENGIYAQITTEMERLKVLGKIPASTPFLQAYKQVGEHLFGGAQPGQPAAQGQQAPQLAPRKLGEKTAAPKPKVTNGDKASAASPSRSTPRKAQETVNPLAMKDEDFLEQFANRL